MFILKTVEKQLRSGIYEIQTKFEPKIFQVACDEELFDGGWTVILRRMDGSVDFYRDWVDYKQGFGNLDGEFFIGLDKLYALTNGQYTQELIFVMEDFDYVRKYAKYSSFVIGDESESYRIKALGSYSGDAGNAFTYHANQTFKTKDSQGDLKHCAVKFSGAWWYDQCYFSNLCGIYLKKSDANFVTDARRGINWNRWKQDYPLRFVQMMIRPRRQ